MVAGIMGSHHRKRRQFGMTNIKNFTKDTNGDAVVEATILFPIMIMIFAALVLLAIYLPLQSVLQRATQHAATAVATEISDTWLFFDEGSMTYYWKTDKNELTNVYAGLFSGNNEALNKGEDIVIYVENRSISAKTGDLSINFDGNNKILYMEVIAEASRDIPMPVNLSFIGFPESITVTSTSVVLVKNADEFIRNVDLAVTFAGFISEKFGITNITEGISSFGDKVSGILGW